MTILELEQRSGLSRASVRFYEAEGFIAPARRENGYRDYSEADLELLLRLKLLESRLVHTVTLKQAECRKRNKK